MNNSECGIIGPIFLGIFIGAMGLATLYNYSEQSFYNVYHKEIEKCEANLPRNQECMIIAIPKPAKEVK